MFTKIKNLTETGDTIIEVLIVLAVLSLAFAISSATATHGLLQSHNAQEHSQGLGLQVTHIEQLRTAVAAQANVFQAAPFCMTGATSFDNNFDPSFDPAATLANDNFNLYPLDCRYTSGGVTYYNRILYVCNAACVADGGANSYFEFRTRWDGAGSLGRQQEIMVYKMHALTPNAVSGVGGGGGSVSAPVCPQPASNNVGTGKVPQPGDIVYSDSFDNSSLYAIRPSGGAPFKINTDQSTGTARVSPNNSGVVRIAYATPVIIPGVGSVWNIVVANSDGTNRIVLTCSANLGVDPTWSPDGKWIAYIQGNYTTGSKLMVVKSDGSAAPQVLDNSGYDAEPFWSHDGKEIAFVRQTSALQTDGIDILPVTETAASVTAGAPSLYVASPNGGSGDTDVAIFWPQFSPDDSQILYDAYGISKNSSGGWSRFYDLYKVNFPTAGTPKQLTKNYQAPIGGWSPDGSKIAIAATGPYGASYFIGVIDSDPPTPVQVAPLPSSHTVIQTLVDYVP